MKQNRKQLPQLIHVVGGPPFARLAAGEPGRRKPGSKKIGWNRFVANSMQRNAEIAKLQEPVRSNKDITWRYIPMDRACAMKENNGTKKPNNLATSLEFSPRLGILSPPQTGHAAGIRSMLRDAMPPPPAQS
jgi:hypothetical protein